MIKKRKVLIAVFLVLYALLTAFFYGRHYTVITPHLLTETDTGFYSVVADAILAGKQHYVEVWDHKGPLWALFFTIPMLLDTSSYMGILYLWAVNHIVIFSFSYLIARLFLSQTASVLVVFVLPFAVLGNFAANPSEIVLSFQLISLYLFLIKYLKQQSINIWPLFGFFVGCTLLFKFNLIAFWAPFLLWDAISLWKNQGGGLLLRRIAQFCLVIACVSLFTFSFISPYETWVHYVLFNLFYAGESAPFTWLFVVDLVEGFSFTRDWGKAVPIPLFVHIAVGLFFALAWIVFSSVLKSRAIFWTLCAAFCLCLVAVFSGGRVYYQYYNTFKPFYILALIWGLRYVSIRCGHRKPRLSLRFVLPSALLIGCGLLASYLFVSVRYRDVLVLDQQTRQDCEYIRNLTTRGEDLLVINADAGYYHMTGNVSPIRYPAPPGIDFRNFPHHINAWKESVASRQCQYILVGNMQSENYDGNVFLSRRKVTSFVLSHGYEPVGAPLVHGLTLYRRIQ